MFSSNLVRAKMASATAALVTVAQVSDRQPCNLKYAVTRTEKNT